MATGAEVRDTEGRWVFIAPVDNLYLRESVKREIRIDRVLFVSAKKLAHIRSRLHIPFPVSKWRHVCQEDFKSAPSLAIIHHTGKPNELSGECLGMVREESLILTVSQLGYARRSSVAHVGLYGEVVSQGFEYLFLNKEDKTFAGCSSLTTGHQALDADGHWKEWQSKFFFTRLLMILHKKVQVDPPWRECLKKAAILVGKSLSTYDAPDAFLWNMIALESLLTRQGDKYTDAIPERIEAFLGWVGFWAERKYEERIREAYRVRCKLVHQGDASGVTEELLLFTDVLMLNLFFNLTRHPKLFNSKEAVVNFAERVKAERVLGLNGKVRPKTLRALASRYEGERKRGRSDIGKIDNE
jgi:hypothetical protein